MENVILNVSFKPWNKKLEFSDFIFNRLNESFKILIQGLISRLYITYMLSFIIHTYNICFVGCLQV